MSVLKETWILTESTGSWSQVSCRRGPCPSARMMTSVAHDPLLGQYVLFGGMDGQSRSLDDTHVFGAGGWSARSPFQRPPARAWAAAAFVPSPVNRVVLFGGSDLQGGDMSDMWVWSGSDWIRIDAPGGPKLFGHSMAWDAGSGRLIVTGGLVDSTQCNLVNTDTWAFTFRSANSGTWEKTALSCAQGASPKPESMMALDIPSGKKVFFAGGENGPNGVIYYNDTVVCQ